MMEKKGLPDGQPRDPGPHGVTVDMNTLDRMNSYRPAPRFTPTVRDRSLRGKQRRLARKAAQRDN